MLADHPISRRAQAAAARLAAYTDTPREPLMARPESVSSHPAAIPYQIGDPSLYGSRRNQV